MYVEVHCWLAQEEGRGAKEQESSMGDSQGLRGHAASPAAAAQANHIAQADKGGFGTPTAPAAQQVRYEGKALRQARSV